MCTFWYLEFFLKNHFFKGSAVWLCSFFKFGFGWNFEKWAKSFFLFQISKCTHFSTIRMMEKNVCHQKWSHSSSLKCRISILNTLYKHTWTKPSKRNWYIHLTGYTKRSFRINWKTKSIGSWRKQTIKKLTLFTFHIL